MYIPSVIIHLNSLFDSQTPVIVTTQVVDKQIKKLKDYTVFKLTVKLDTDSEQLTVLKVPIRTYNNVKVGENVDVIEHTGFFDIEYAVLESKAENQNEAF